MPGRVGRANGAHAGLNQQPLDASSRPENGVNSAGTADLCLVVRVITMQIPTQEVEAEIVIMAEVHPDLERA